MATGTPRNKCWMTGAFTLIELILVMALIVVATSLVLPRMQPFFRGQYLDDEARRFLALTRYGQSRAVAEGVPVDLWINPVHRQYGLAAVGGYTETQTNSVAIQDTFTLDSTLTISFSAPSSVLVRSNYWTQAQGQLGAVAHIRFQPDGFISDNSPQHVYLRQDRAQIRLDEAPTHMEYDIQSTP